MECLTVYTIISFEFNKIGILLNSLPVLKIPPHLTTSSLRQSIYYIVEVNAVTSLTFCIVM